jgi:hypothetical protein
MWAEVAAGSILMVVMLVCSGFVEALNVEGLVLSCSLL